MVKGIASVRSILEIAPGVLHVDALLVDPPVLQFRAGQFLTLKVGPEGIRRPYSIASPARRTDGFELVVKKVPGGTGTSWFERLRPGDQIHFTGPVGFFTVEPVHPGDAVFAVTGAGIAAALPMIDEILERPAAIENGRVLLFWGLRAQRDLYFQDRLDDLAARSGRLEMYLCLSRPSPGWAGTHGRITRHLLEALRTLSCPIFYLVGNGTMVHELQAALAEQGIDRRHRIRTEIFFTRDEP